MIDAKITTNNDGSINTQLAMHGNTTDLTSEIIALYSCVLKSLSSALSGNSTIEVLANEITLCALKNINNCTSTTISLGRPAGMDIL